MLRRATSATLTTTSRAAKASILFTVPD